MKRLMVVDDEEIIRDIVRDIVEMNYENLAVDTASSGTEAIDLMRGNHYDIIFLDMKMEMEDGLDIYREMRRMSPKQTVFIITGYTDEERNLQVLKEGARGTIYKPFKVDEITGIIDEYILNRQTTVRN